MPAKKHRLIGGKNIRLRRRTKAKLSDAGIRTIEGLTRFSTSGFLRRVRQFNEFSFDELLEIAKALSKPGEDLPFFHDSIGPNDANHGILLTLWEQNVFTWRDLSKRNEPEIAVALKKSGAAHLPSKMEELVKRLSGRGRAPKPCRSRDVIGSVGSLPRKVVYQFYFDGIFTLKELSEHARYGSIGASYLPGRNKQDVIAIYLVTILRQRRTARKPRSE